MPADWVPSTVGKLTGGLACIAVTDRGFLNVDAQMRTNVPHIFATR